MSILRLGVLLAFSAFLTLAPITGVLSGQESTPVANSSGDTPAEGDKPTEGDKKEQVKLRILSVNDSPAAPGAARQWLDPEQRTGAALDGDAHQDPTEPSGEATKAWTLPASTPGQVTGGGQIPNARDAKAIAFGFNAQTEEYVDMISTGIVDPAKVVRTALQDAASVAGLLITTEAMIAEAPKEKAAMPPMPGGGGMGGMGGMDF